MPEQQSQIRSADSLSKGSLKALLQESRDSMDLNQNTAPLVVDLGNGEKPMTILGVTKTNPQTGTITNSGRVEFFDRHGRVKWLVFDQPVSLHGTCMRQMITPPNAHEWFTAVANNDPGGGSPQVTTAVEVIDGMGNQAGIKLSLDDSPKRTWFGTRLAAAPGVITASFPTISLGDSDEAQSAVSNTNLMARVCACAAEFAVTEYADELYNANETVNQMIRLRYADELIAHREGKLSSEEMEEILTKIETSPEFSNWFRSLRIAASAIAKTTSVLADVARRVGALM